MNRKCALALLATAAALAVAVALPLVMAQQPMALVTVTAVEQQTVASTHAVVGTVMPVRTSSLGSAVSGRVEQFLFNEGDRVLRGQPVARLRTKVIAAELAFAASELKLRRAELAEWEAGSRPEEKEKARAQIEHAEAVLQLAKAKRRRAEAAGRGVSAEEVEAAISLEQQAHAAHVEALNMFKLLEPRIEKIEQARAKVEAQQAEVDRLQEQLDRHTVFAPFDGYIVAEHTEVGHWLLQGGAIVEIAELDEVDIEVQVLEDYAAYLKLGASARVEIGALPDEILVGRVSSIVPRANPRARTFPVKVRVPNRFQQDQRHQSATIAGKVALIDSSLSAPLAVGAGWLVLERTRGVLLKAGMFARVTLPVGKTQKALLVPRDALVLGGPVRKVYAFDPDPSNPNQGKVREVPVELGVADETRIEVRGNLAPGQLVIVEGNARVFPGQMVQVLRREKQ